MSGHTILKGLGHKTEILLNLSFKNTKLTVVFKVLLKITAEIRNRTRSPDLQPSAVITRQYLCLY